MANTPAQAISVAKQMISNGVVYAYGFKYETITKAKVESLASQYPSVYTASIKNLVLGKVGKTGIDCSGYVCRAFGLSNIGSSQLMAKMTNQYKVSDASKIKNGMIIWRQGHIALLEVDETGIPWVLEAKGTSYDLCRTLYSTRGRDFTYYGELSGIDYSEARTVNETSFQTSSIRDIIDISHHNTLNFSKVSAEYQDIIIRVGYRSYSTGALTLDSKFLEHSKSAIENGMNMGFYIWDQSINEQEAIEQADWIIGLIKPLPVSYPIFIDSEYYNSSRKGRADKLTKDQRTKNIVAFCERIKELGYIPGVYASNSWFTSQLDFSKLSIYEIWCARYSSSSPTISKYDIWQYGSKVISGSSAAIDINHIYKDYPKLINSSLNTQPTTPSAAKYYCTVTASTLNVRNKPNTITGKVVDTIQKNSKVNIYSLQNNWARISSSAEKYCSYKYLTPTIGKVTNCQKLNCRKTPTTGAVSFVLSQNDKINILNQDEETKWYYIEFNGKSGYVSNKYISIEGS